MSPQLPVVRLNGPGFQESGWMRRCFRRHHTGVNCFLNDIYSVSGSHSHWFMNGEETEDAWGRSHGVVVPLRHAESEFQKRVKTRFPLENSPLSSYLPSLANIIFYYTCFRSFKMWTPRVAKAQTFKFACPKMNWTVCTSRLGKKPHYLELPGKAHFVYRSVKYFETPNRKASWKLF